MGLFDLVWFVGVAGVCVCVCKVIIECDNNIYIGRDSVNTLDFQRLTKQLVLEIDM